MTLEQLYISSLRVPAIELKAVKKNLKIEFKKGKILSNSYISMLKRISKRDGLYVICHSQTIYTFCFVKGVTAYFIGPEIINDNSEHRFNLDSRQVYLSRKLNTEILEKSQCYDQIRFFSQLIHLDLNVNQIDQCFDNAVSSRQLDDVITAVHFEDEGVHISYIYEQALKAAITQGDSSAVHSAFVSLIDSGRIGVLSDKGEVRAIKNWGIICISVTLRAAIDAGMDYDQAYSLNDQYVMLIESLSVFDDIMDKIEQVLEDMADRVSRLKNVHLTKDIRRIYEIILNSPESSPTIPELSNQIGLSEHYLSNNFKKEVGISISHFKLLVKINRTVQLISTTNAPISEIAAKLNFSDQAHLSREFKKFVGVSPSYARKHFRSIKDWNMYNFMNINVG